MSSRFLNGLFGPDVPVWACELTPRRAVVVRASDDRLSMRARASAPVKPGALVADLKDANVVDSAELRSAVGRSLDEAGFFGSDLVLVVPDDAVRVALIDVESFPSAPAEQLAFIRWKFKKNVPFDVGSARVSWDRIDANGAIRLLTALAPESIIRQYEEVVESFGLHAGLVLPSTLAALGLFPASGGDLLFVKKGPDVITTSILTDGKIRFYRKVAVQGLYEAAYPTFMYYQDKLGGAALTGVVLSGEDIGPDERAELEQGLGMRAETLFSREIDDIFKPSLGALQP